MAVQHIDADTEQEVVQRQRVSDLAGRVHDGDVPLVDDGAVLDQVVGDIGKEEGPQV